MTQNNTVEAVCQYLSKHVLKASLEEEQSAVQNFVLAYPKLGITPQQLMETVQLLLKQTTVSVQPPWHFYR